MKNPPYGHKISMMFTHPSGVEIIYSQVNDSRFSKEYYVGYRSDNTHRFNLRSLGNKPNTKVYFDMIECLNKPNFKIGK